MQVANSRNTVLWILHQLLVESEWVSISDIVRFIQDEIHGKEVSLYGTKDPQGIESAAKGDLSELRIIRLVEENDKLGWRLTGIGEVFAMNLTMPTWAQEKMDLSQ